MEISIGEWCGGGREREGDGMEVEIINTSCHLKLSIFILHDY